MAHSIITHDDLIYDRGIVDCLGYSALSENITEEELKIYEEHFGDALKGCIHFYVPIEFDLVDDGVRSKNEEYRRKTDKWMKDYLDNNDIEYYVLKGTVEERYDKMKEIINKLEAEELF